MLGSAPVLDFDGTLAALDVDWVGLRGSLGVQRIDDLWAHPGGWEAVSEAEVRAAEVADPVAATVDALLDVRCFAVLTSNDSRAVRRFVERFPALQSRLSAVVGREELGGPKTDFARFERGLRQCVAALVEEHDGAQKVYVGDSSYELDFARRLGLVAMHVKDLVVGRPLEDS